MFTLLTICASLLDCTTRRCISRASCSLWLSSISYDINLCDIYRQDYSLYDNMAPSQRRKRTVLNLTRRRHLAITILAVSLSTAFLLIRCGSGSTKSSTEPTVTGAITTSLSGGIYLTPPTTTCSVQGHGRRLSADFDGIGTTLSR